MKIFRSVLISFALLVGLSFGSAQASVVYSSFSGGNFDSSQFEGAYYSSNNGSGMASVFTLNSPNTSVGAVRFWGGSVFFQPVSFFRINFFTQRDGYRPAATPFASFDVGAGNPQAAGFDVGAGPGYMYEATIPDTIFSAGVPYYVSILGGDNGEFLWMMLNPTNFNSTSFLRFSQFDDFNISIPRPMAFELLTGLDSQQVPEPAGGLLAALAMVLMIASMRFRPSFKD